MSLLSDHKHFHLIGIAGNGMSAIARCLLQAGYSVSGSDLTSNAVTDDLKKQGALIYHDHDSLRSDADCIVISSAITMNNPEIMQARAKGLPIYHRSDVLSALVANAAQGVGITGSHGKTTTCAMLVDIFRHAHLNPSYALGAALNSTKVNAALSSEKYFIAELDESDASFLKTKAAIAVITNVDEDHMSTYDFSVKKLEAAFIKFANQSGRVVLCVDDARNRGLLNSLQVPCVTYGITHTADVMAKNIVVHDLQSSFWVHEESQAPYAVTLNLPGQHNILNALAAIVVARSCGIAISAIQEALAVFAGVNRRTQVITPFYVNHKKITLVHDYGHHPVEIAKNLQAMRDVFKGRRLFVVFQPHRYTRTRDLMNEFADILATADLIFLMDIYPASELPITGISSAALYERIQHTQKYYFSDEEIIKHILHHVKEDDVLVIQGAGDLDQSVLAVLKIMNQIK